MTPVGTRALDSDTGGVVVFCFVKAVYERKDDVGVSWAVFVAEAIELGWHDAAIVHPIAFAEQASTAFAKLYASYICD